MHSFWLHRVFDGLAPVAYRAKILAAAALGAAAPFAVLGILLAGREPVDAGKSALLACLALGGMLMALVVLAALLRPIGHAARALERCLGPGAAPGNPESGADEATRIISGIARLARRLRELATRAADRHPITDLPTKEAFLVLLAQRLRQAPTRGVLGVIRFGDYDRLAAFDQAAADRILGAFAGRLAGALNARRLLAHVDRDCFGVWFGDADDPRAAAAELQAIGYVLSQELVNGELEVNSEVGLGAAIYPRDGEHPIALLANALAALRLAHPARTSEVAFASRRSVTVARERFTLEQRLHHAIGGDQFLLHFQPVVDLDAGRVVGAEALLRWRHPELGLIPPGEFIPVLEESSMMDEVGLWVLNAACRQTRILNELGLDGLKMAVNVSGRQLRDGALPATIERTLVRHGLAAAQLEIELTESAALEDENRTRGLLSDLRGLGVGVAIDDFGTGYSSLSKLKSLPFSKLKIDRAFVTRVDGDRQNQAICKSLVELARGLGMTILAEGVETLEEVETVRHLGCSMFQGFFFARPLAAGEFERILADPDWLAILASPARRERAKLHREIAA